MDGTIVDTEPYWIQAETDLVAEHWPRITPHLLAPSPPPDAYFTNQLGSRLAVLTNLRPDGFGAAVDFVLAHFENDFRRGRQGAGPTVGLNVCRREERSDVAIHLEFQLDCHARRAGLAMTSVVPRGFQWVDGIEV